MNDKPVVDIKELERTLLEYFESRPQDWKGWSNGNKVYSRKETITLFKNNGEFRAMVIREAFLLGLDDFVRGIKKARKDEGSVSGS